MIKISGGRIRRRDHRIWFLALGVFVTVFLFTFLTAQFKAINEEVSAADLSKFDPGYIISDYQMGNYNSMTEAEIQAFLTKKNPCGNTQYNEFLILQEKYPNITWRFENGHFVCLSEERFGDGLTVGEGDTAAHIIWQAAQDYKINPQVLIVLLEKEQGLITDDFPNSIQYRSATGYGCPDNAPCAEEYYGFKNQVRKAAAMFRSVLDGGWTNYPLGENYIQYNPSASCGGSVVNIQNLATSALYRYTPYQPNAAALAAGYGTVHCGAYGNRNFYLYFEDWFGGIQDKIGIDVNIYDIDPGEYFIVPASNVDTSLQLTNNSLAVSSRKNGDLDVFDFYKIDNGYYTIAHKISNTALDVADSASTVDNNVLLWSVHNADNQQWMIYRNENGTYSIASKLNLELVISYKNGRLVLDRYSREENIETQFYLVARTAPIMDSEVYKIQSAARKELVLDIYGGTTPETEAGLLSTYSQKSGINDNQTFKFIYDQTGYYRIINTHTGLNVTTSSTDFANGVRIDVLPQSQNCGQLWEIRRNDNELEFVSSCSLKVLDLNVDTGEINLFAYHGGKNQRWRLAQVINDGTYTIASALSEEYYLTSTGILEDVNLKKEIKPTEFRIAYDKQNGCYRISDENGLVLDLANSSLMDGGNIIAFSEHGGVNQCWYITPNSDNLFNITSAKSGKNIDIWESDLFTGKIIQWQKHAAKNQKWVFSKVFK